ncbi:Exc2 family lipoprotein [Raoultella sp. WB_B2P2-3]|uniref:Exc2 family lipoprotein n=1 Tax=Raoultella TaxID=160674 RepID=UPI000BA362EE|nr:MULTISPECIES: Exc2 family lipoprotein [Enterobacteriaceae]MVT01414.1 Exc2 family lipoprotein [Raoultella sp. 10-1]PAC13961.1 hypothetical protein CD006_01775 [Enterobacter sp. 10-1]
MKLKSTIIAIACAAAVLSGCSASKPSPERHAYYFVSHRSDFVGGNFAVNVQDNYRLNLPTFSKIYQLGKEDRAAGMSESDARSRAEQIKQQASQGTKTEHSFDRKSDDKWTSSMEDKDAQLFGRELSAAYLDGYLGVK